MPRRPSTSWSSPGRSRTRPAGPRSGRSASTTWAWPSPTSATRVRSRTCGRAWRWPWLWATTSTSHAAYTNLNETLYRLGRWDAMDRSLADGLTFTLERDFRSHAYNLEVHRCLLLAHRGQWDDAEAGLRALVESVDEPGIMYLYSVPALGRLLARRGDAAAGPMLSQAWDRACGHRSLLGRPAPGSPSWSGAGGAARRTVRCACATPCSRGCTGRGRPGGAGSCCATSPGPASRPRRSTAARRHSTPGCAGTGRAPRLPGSASATRTSVRSSSASPAT